MAAVRLPLNLKKFGLGVRSWSPSSMLCFDVLCVAASIWPQGIGHRTRMRAPVSPPKRLRVERRVYRAARAEWALLAACMHARMPRAGRRPELRGSLFGAWTQ